MIRIPQCPTADGLQKNTETWALGVGDALTGVYGRARRTRTSGFSKEPTTSYVAGNGNIATVFMKYPIATTASIATIWFLEVVTRDGGIAPLKLNGILLVMDLTDMSITGQLVEDGVAVLTDKTYTDGFVISGSLSLTEE